MTVSKVQTLRQIFIVLILYSLALPVGRAYSRGVTPAIPVVSELPHCDSLIFSHTYLHLHRKISMVKLQIAHSNTILRKLLKAILIGGLLVVPIQRLIISSYRDGF